jgi:branched-chain amino acid transport system permease protein
VTDYLFYLLLGTGAGAIIAAMGLGLVVTYQGSGVVNFAHGAIVMWTTYVYAELREGAYTFPIPGLPDRYHFGEDVGFRWALLLSLLTAGVLALGLYLVVFRPLRRAPALAKVVASVGLVIVFTALVDRRFADKSVIRVDPVLPREPVQFTDDLTIPRDGLWLTAIVLLVTLAVWAAYRYTRVGLATRGAAECEKGAVLLGYSPDALAALGWVLAALIGGFVGILAAPLIQLSPGIFTFGFLVPALGAALIGSFRRPWPTVLTGLAIGMVQSTFTKLQNDWSWFPRYGAREGLPFLLIIITMVVLGERLPERGAVDTWRLPAAPPARVTPATVLLPTAAAAAGLLFLGPLWRGAIMTTIVAAVLALSIVVVTGFGGQTSLAQMAFAGIAGFTLSKLTTAWDVPFPLAPLLAAGAAAVVGMVLGLPALRIRGTNLAIITLAGGVAISEFVFKNPTFVGDIASGGAKVPNPRLGGWDLGLVRGTQSSRPVFGLFLLAVLVVLALAVANIRRSPSGRRMLAVRSNERAAAAAGVDVAAEKLRMFALSSFIAGVGGTLVAYRFGSVSDVSFGLVASLTVLSVAYLGGITSVSGAITAGVVAASGVAFYGMSQVIGSLGTWEAFIGGVLLVLTAVQNPEGIAGAVRARTALARRQRAGQPAAQVEPARATTLGVTP